MQKRFSTLGVVAAAFIALAAWNQPAAAVEPEQLSMRETPSTCMPQEELRKLAVHRCELIDAVITNVRFIDLCGANGHAPMYSTILYDCHPSRALH